METSADRRWISGSAVGASSGGTVGRRTASEARPTLPPFTSSAAEAFASTRTVREPFPPPFARALSARGALMPTQVADIFFSLFSLWCVCVCLRP